MVINIGMLGAEEDENAAKVKWRVEDRVEGCHSVLALT
jgi:hypothetical protein